MFSVRPYGGLKCFCGKKSAVVLIPNSREIVQY